MLCAELSDQSYMIVIISSASVASYYIDSYKALSPPGIKPYKCLFCQKAFSRRAHMLEHQQSHTDNYRFRCSTCNKGFTRQSYYRDHKCPAAGDGTGTAEETAEAAADEVRGVPMAEEEEEGEADGTRGRFARKVKKSGTKGDDSEKNDSSNGTPDQVETHREEEERERRRTDEGCQAAMSITVIEGQMDREEEADRMEHGCKALEQIQGNDQNCLQPPCL